jgi:hypothetical protein
MVQSNAMLTTCKNRLMLVLKGWHNADISAELRSFGQPSTGIERQSVIVLGEAMNHGVGSCGCGGTAASHQHIVPANPPSSVQTFSVLPEMCNGGRGLLQDREAGEGICRPSDIAVGGSRVTSA